METAGGGGTVSLPAVVLEFVSKDVTMAGAARTRASDSTQYVEYEEYVDFQSRKRPAGSSSGPDILTTSCTAFASLGIC